MVRATDVEGGFGRGFVDQHKRPREGSSPVCTSYVGARFPNRPGRPLVMAGKTTMTLLELDGMSPSHGAGYPGYQNTAGWSKRPWRVSPDIRYSG